MGGGCRGRASWRSRKGFVDAVKSTGYDGVWGVEILSAEYRKRPIEEAVPDAYRSTVQYLR